MSDAAKAAKLSRDRARAGRKSAVIQKERGWTISGFNRKSRERKNPRTK